MIASEIMTKKPRTVRVNASVRSALDMLWTLEVRHLPVVDDSGDIVGILSDRDLGSLMKTLTDGDGSARGTVGDFMSGNVVTVDTDTDLEEVIETLLEQRIGAVPVLDGDGALAGIISYVDILRTYSGELSGGASGVTTQPAATEATSKVRAAKRTPAKPKKTTKPKTKTKTKKPKKPKTPKTKKSSSTKTKTKKAS